jgi:hypothetical protein
MNITQRRVKKVLERMMDMYDQDEANADMFSEMLEASLNELSYEDAFGTEGSSDPRGDFREDGWSMKFVQGVDK